MNKNNELNELLLLGLDTMRTINFQQSISVGSNPLSSKMAEEAGKNAKNEKEAIQNLYQSFIEECLQTDILKKWALKNQNELKKFSNYFIKTYFENL